MPLFSKRVSDTCTVAVEVGELHITVHFKLDDQVRRIYVHPDNIVLKTGKKPWAERVGDEYTFNQNAYKARESIRLLCQALQVGKADRASWQQLTVDQVMASMCEEIEMSITLWTRIKKWVNGVVSELVRRTRLAVGYHSTAGGIAWIGEA